MAQILIIVSRLNDRTKTNFHSHGTVCKNDRNANLLGRGHMQRPKQRHGHEQEHEVDKDVAKPKDVLHVGGVDSAHRGRKHARFEVESGRHGRAGEAHHEDGNECPNGHDGGNGPGSVTEFGHDFEDAVEEDEDGQFGKGD